RKGDHKIEPRIASREPRAAENTRVPCVKLAAMRRCLSAFAIAAVIAGSAVLSAQSTPARSRAATAADARKFLAAVNAEMLRLINNGNRAGWVQSTYITPDTEVLAAQANELLVNAVTRYAKDAR